MIDDMDISGLRIPEETKQRVMECIIDGRPFGLRSKNAMSVFMPDRLGAALYYDGVYKKCTWVQSNTPHEFRMEIQMALVSQREFVDMSHVLDYVMEFNKIRLEHKILKLR